MDPLAQAMQMLQKAHDVIALLTEELAAAKQGKSEKKEEMQKTASESNISSLFGLTPNELPEFAKFASLEEAMTIRKAIENEMSFGSLGKTAEFDDGTSYNDPAEALNARLAEIISK
jgi:hypothetical protein